VASWAEFIQADPELAALGAERLHGQVAYLATVRGDGSPRVHPVTPIVGGGQLFLFMEPTSPKGNDLRREPRYALHSAVADNSGSGGEFHLRGSARPVADPAVRQLAVASASYEPRDRYVLFALDVDGAMLTLYDGDRPVRRRWGAI
jgi:hypothetical protein